MKGGMRGYLTVYLAMTLGILVSLSLVLIRGVRQSTLRLESLCISEIGMDNIMAEYHRELFERFGILALDSSYGGRTMGWVNTEERLRLYLDKNLPQERTGGAILPGSLLYRDMLHLQVADVTLSGAALLTDHKGAVFRNQAIRVMEDDLGLGVVQELGQWMQTVEEYRINTRDIQSEKAAADAQIASIRENLEAIREEEGELAVFENPTLEIEKQRRKGILRQTISGEVSGKQLNTMSLVYRRLRDGRVNCGNMPLEASGGVGEAVGRGLFQEYLLKYLGCYGDVREDSALDYGVEYTILGKDKDVDNLQGVFQRITAMREAANTVYLYQDSSKKQQADGVAWMVALLTGTPELKEPLSAAIIMGWAYAESVYDMKQLAAGGRVPLIKDRSTWHYDLWQALRFWQEDPVTEGEGLCYEDYLRILMSLTDLDQLTGRAMDLVEGDIRMTEGNSRFRMDGCYTSLCVEILMEGAQHYETDIQQIRTY